MISDPALLLAYRRHAEALGRDFTADDDGDRAAHDLDGHGERLAADPDDPPAHRHRRRAARSTTSRRSPRRARRRPRTARSSTAPIALALTGIDVATDASLRERLGAALARAQPPGR